MSLETPISLMDEANIIQGILDAWAQGHGGDAKIMANLRHLWEEILRLSDQPRIMVCYTGEIARGGFNIANRNHRVDRQWTVVVMRGHGFRNLMAESRDGIEIPFYTVIETIRDMIRCITNISEEFPLDYKAIQPLPNAGPSPNASALMDCFQITFSTANDIPGVSLIAPT